MRLIVKHEPLKRVRKIPFSELRVLGSHKEHFLSGIGLHQQKGRPRLPELVLIRTVHFVDERQLSVHHLVVRYRQDVVLGKSIHKREIQRRVLIFAEDGVGHYVIVEIVCPAHIPLKIKSETARADGVSYTRKGG